MKTNTFDSRTEHLNSYHYNDDEKCSILLMTVNIHLFFSLLTYAAQKFGHFYVKQTINKISAKKIHTQFVSINSERFRLQPPMNWWFSQPATSSLANQVHHPSIHRTQILNNHRLTDEGVTFIIRLNGSIEQSPH